MKSTRQVTLTENSTIEKALKIIDHGEMKIALVVDGNNKLLGTIADGDIRRALLRGIKIHDSIKCVIHRDFICVKIGTAKDQIIALAREHKIYQIPVVDANHILVGIEELSGLIETNAHKTKVVLMVGGLGARLRPLTRDMPKSLLKVGGVPILETIIQNFSKYGFKSFILSVNYKAQMIKDYFGNGEKFGVIIEYIYEDKRMGTAGSLSLMNGKLGDNFFVMNGDLLTNVNFEHLLNYHLDSKSVATMCVRQYEFKIPYGVVNIDNDRITSIDEKPLHEFFVNAGIYLLNSDVLSNIPDNQFYDMPTLFEQLIQDKKSIISFPIREYWLDIGVLGEFKKANSEYKDFFYYRK